MTVTTNNIVDMLRNVIELLKIDDDEKVDLAIDILMLVISFVGAQNIVDTLENGVENAFEYVSELITGESSDLTFEQRSERMKLTRSKLDALFEKMSEVQDVTAV